MVCARRNDLAFNDSLDCSLTDEIAEAEMCIQRLARGSGELAWRGKKGAARVGPPACSVYFQLTLCALKEANCES
jgi:hypothetical protein